jgi:hypothetical protein
MEDTREPEVKTPPPEGAGDKVTEKQEKQQDGQGEPLKLTQSEIDSLISKAVAKNQARISKEMEKSTLEQQGKYQELLEQERRERKTLELKLHANSLIQSQGLDPDLADDLVSLGDKDRIESFVSKLRNYTQQLAEKQIKDRVKTAPPPAGGTAPPPDPLKDPTAYAEWRKTQMKR